MQGQLARYRKSIAALAALKMEYFQGVDRAVLRLTALASALRYSVVPQ
jgi:hypothetical protein